VTKRPRRIGWFDLVALKHAIRVGGITEIALTRADILSGLPVKICIAYKSEDNGWIDQVPSSAEEYSRVKPVIKELDGWSMKTGDKKLPVNLIKFAELIEEEIKIPITMISTGPEASQTILINKEDRDLIE
jgi:adenylosuccinate synthase